MLPEIHACLYWATMQTHIAALILVVVIIGCINIAACEGPWCYDCDKAVKPGSCGEIIKCKDDEQCYASSTGISPTQYTAGCRKKQLCQGTGSVLGGSSPHGCEECCIGDHCNSKLCGGLPVPMGGSRLCLQCEAVLHPSQCSTVSKCGQDKYCSIWKRRRFQMTFYDLGCLEKTECDGHMKGVDELSHGGFICCNDDLCNSHENNNHLTPAPTQPATTTSQPATTIRTGNIKCKKCAFVQQPAFCSSETDCGPDQYCSVREVFRFGLAFYELGCEEKTECVGHMKTLGERGFRCCNEERCNANANPVTGRTTPAITTPATTETSASPTKTASLPPTTTLRRGNIKCKKCAIVEQPSFCSSETECGPDQYCSVRKVFRFGITFFDLGCEEKTECLGHMTTLGEAGFRCCNEDRCNANVNPVTGSTVPSVTTPSSPDTSTPSATSSYLPTMAPDILNRNQTVNVIAGKTVLLLCNVTGNPEPSVTWTYDKQGNPNAHPKGSTLAISSANEKNEGIYRCVANNTLGSKEGIVHLHVIEPVTVKGEPPIVVINPGMRIVRLKCVGEGIPPPSVTLSKYGEDITADKSYAHLRPAEILIMGITEANVLKYDGVYVCNATNGHTSASAYQIVAGNVTRMLAENVPFNNISTTPLKAFHALCPPGSTQPDSSPITTEFDLGEPVCTSARKVGLIDTDAGSVTWLIRPNGKALFLNGSMTVDLKQLSTTSIPLTSTIASSLASSTATSSLPLIAPDISNTNQTVNAILGETVLLFCNVSGNPTPSVTWEYDKSVSPNAHPKESTLAISSIVKQNEGIYKCVANNSQGIKEAIVHVHVTEPVSVKGEPPIVVISPGMRIARLKCVGEGIPPPSVTLNKYGEDISADKSYLHSGPAEILIMGITEANLLKYDGVYVCNATNGHTSASAYQIVAINVTTPVDGHVPFNNISTTPLKAFHAMCPPGLTGPDGSSITHEFNLDEVVCTSARKVGIIDTNPGLVTWLIRPDGKAQFLNGSLSVDLGQVNTSAAITTPSTSVNSSVQVTSTLPTMLSQSLSMQPSTMSNIQSIESLITAFSHTMSIMATSASYATHVPLASLLAPSNNVIMSHSSEAVTSSSQSLFLPPSLTAPESSSHTMLMTSFPSSLTSPSMPSGGTYASSKDMSSSEELSFSSSQTVAITSLPSSIISSEASAGASTSSKGATSWMTSSSPSPTLAMTSLQSNMISSSQPSPGTYASSKAVSSMLSSETLPYPSSDTVAMVSLPSSIISSEASAGTTASSKGASSGMMSSSLSPTLASSKASAGTYASSRGVSSSGMESNSPSPGLEMTSVPTRMISSPETSTGAYASSRGVSSSMSSSESLPYSSSQTVAMTSLPSTMISSSEASAGTYASSRGVSSSGMASSSSSLVLEMTYVPTGMISSSEVSTGTYASSKGVPSSVLGSNSPSPTLAMTSLPSTMISPSEASAGSYSSSEGVSSSGMRSNSPSPTLAMTSVPTSMISSSEASAGTYASSRGVSSSGMASSSSSPALEMTSVPTSIISSPEASAGTSVSSRGVSSSGMASSSTSLVLEMTSVPTGMISSSKVSAGTYASSKGVSSSVMRSNSPSPNLAMTPPPSTIISSSEASAGSYSSSRGVSSSGMASSSSSPALEMTSVPTSIISSPEASAGTSASSKGVSSSGMASSSTSLVLEMTSVPTGMMSSSEVSAGTYASSRGVLSSRMAPSSISPTSAITSIPSSIYLSQASVVTSASSKGVSSSGMASSSSSPALEMTSVPTSIISSPEASAGTYASSKGVSSSGMGSNSPSTLLAMTSVSNSRISSPEASASTYAPSRGESASESLPSSSTTISLSVPASSVSSAAYLFPSQSSVNQMLSSHPAVSPSGSISFTSFLPTPTSSRVSLPAAVTSSLLSTAITNLPSASALLSDIISPSSSLLLPGRSSAIPGTYKQEPPTTEGTTITTTIPRVAPSISNPSQNVNAFFGENVILSCDVTGVPQPSVTWYYNTQDIYNAKPDGNNLSLAYVTNDNTGDYTCVAENSVGVANGTIHVKINKPITISVEKPVVVLEPDSVTQLLCKTKVQPPPKFTWSKYGGRLDLSTDPSIVDFGDGEMLLTGVNKTNIQQYEGIYICHADNGVSTNEAYVVAADNITKTLDNSKKFSEIGMKPGEAFHAICVPGTVGADGSSLPTRFASTDSICDSARRVGVLAKDAGPVTWFIRLDGKAEFVNETKGAVLSIADAPTTRDVPTSQLPDKATIVKASLSCETCSGPRCGMVPGSDTQCPSMTPFCMTTINTKADGRKSVTKSCASVNDCETKWWQLTSDDNKCEKLVPGNPYYQDFTCSYCCIESGCNKDGIPKKDTLYKGNI
ncbi:mucin-17-like [Haliotis rufescens]|uniref:mucin-17-like n=1 Tax=Haliotis rufescens TaxID=6454 RepID=UPI00201F714C|nr:mucin-17-like [Haliotis rufescens]